MIKRDAHWLEAASHLLAGGVLGRAVWRDEKVIFSATAGTFAAKALSGPLGAFLVARDSRRDGRAYFMPYTLDPSDLNADDWVLLPSDYLLITRPVSTADAGARAT